MHEIIKRSLLFHREFHQKLIKLMELIGMFGDIHADEHTLWLVKLSMRLQMTNLIRWGLELLTLELLLREGRFLILFVLVSVWVA